MQLRNVERSDFVERNQVDELIDRIHVRFTERGHRFRNLELQLAQDAIAHRCRHGALYLETDRAPKGRRATSASTAARIPPAGSSPISRLPLRVTRKVCARTTSRPRYKLGSTAR